MGEVTSFAKVETRFQGLHRWDDAPAEVKFLRNEHRHEFHVIVQVEQFHDDREVEYIMLKRWVDEQMDKWPYNRGQSSCEMMADQLLQKLKEEYGQDRQYRIEINEDGENGALLEYES